MSYELVCGLPRWISLLTDQEPMKQKANKQFKEYMSYLQIHLRAKRWNAVTEFHFIYTLHAPASLPPRCLQHDAMFILSVLTVVWLSAFPPVPQLQVPLSEPPCFPGIFSTRFWCTPIFDNQSRAD